MSLNVLVVPLPTVVVREGMYLVVATSGTVTLLVAGLTVVIASEASVVSFSVVANALVVKTSSPLVANGSLVTILLRFLNRGEVSVGASVLGEESWLLVLTLNLSLLTVV